jgi:hypothetical protein
MSKISACEENDTSIQLFFAVPELNEISILLSRLFLCRSRVTVGLGYCFCFENVNSFASYRQAIVKCPVIDIFSIRIQKMQHVARMGREMRCTGPRKSENCKGRVHLVDLGFYGRVILKYILKPEYEG